MSSPEDRISALAELAVHFGANVQPGQIVALSSAPGKEPLARAIAGSAYRAGARFVDMSVFDVHLKRARVLHADPDTLGYVPPWLGEQVLALGRERGASIALTGPSAPHALDGLDPELVGRDILPWLPEVMVLVNGRQINWTVVPAPTREWAALVHPELDPDAAFERLWEQIAHVCRLDEPDPVAAWERRFDELARVAATLTDRRLDAIHLNGPGTDLTVGLLPSSRWLAAAMQTADGIDHHPNLPSEEIFTSPDPERVDGVVSATKPLFTAGTTIPGIRVRFEAGRAVQVDADDNAELLRGLTARDDGAARLGELALVDREGRIGPLQTIFYDTLLDENAASHIAFGAALEAGVDDEADQPRVNVSSIHVDFMIGSDALAVDGETADGETVALLRDGRWCV